MCCSAGLVALFLNLTLDSFNTTALTPHPCGRWLGRLQGRFGRRGEERNDLPLWESNPGHPFRNLSLHRLSHSGYKHV